MAWGGSAWVLRSITCATSCLVTQYMYAILLIAHVSNYYWLWHFLLQSNPLNGSTLGLTKNWTNKQIEPLTSMFYYESTEMGLAKTWTNNRIEPLSGDPLSGLDCNILLALTWRFLLIFFPPLRRGFTDRSNTKKKVLAPQPTLIHHQIAGECLNKVTSPGFGFDLLDLIELGE